MRGFVRTFDLPHARLQRRDPWHGALPFVPAVHVSAAEARAGQGRRARQGRRASHNQALSSSGSSASQGVSPEQGRARAMKGAVLS